MKDFLNLAMLKIAAFIIIFMAGSFESNDDWFIYLNTLLFSGSMVFGMMEKTWVSKFVKYGSFIVVLTLFKLWL